MPRHKSSAHPLWAALIVAITLICNTAAHAQQAQQAQQAQPVIIKSASGDVSLILPDQSEKKAAPNMQVPLGSRIRTGSDGETRLQLPDGSTLAVHSNSTIPVNATLLRAEPAGKVLFVHGTAEIISSDDLYREAIPGSRVYQGDEISTASASSVQIRMTDGGYFAVRPESKVALNQYLYANKASDKVHTTVFYGGLRSISGNIGKRQQSAFKLNTPVATIGIRGTDLEAYYLSPEKAAEKQQKSGQEAPSGSYLKVNSGEAELANAQGQQPVKANEFAFTGSPEQKPEALPKDKMPLVFTEPTYETLIPGLNAPLPAKKQPQEPVYPKRRTEKILALGLESLSSPLVYDVNMSDNRVQPLPAPALYSITGERTDYLTATLGARLMQTDSPERKVWLSANLKHAQTNDPYDINRLLISLGGQKRLASGITLLADASVSLMRLTETPPQGTRGHLEHRLSLQGYYPLQTDTQVRLKGQWQRLSPHSGPHSQHTLKQASLGLQQHWQQVVLSADLLLSNQSGSQALLPGNWQGLALQAQLPVSAVNIQAGVTAFRGEDNRKQDADLIRGELSAQYPINNALTLIINGQITGAVNETPQQEMIRSQLSYIF